jgi:nucleoid DNA-binding protein
MAKTNHISEITIQETAEQVVRDSLLKGEHVVIPDFGHLEVKLLQDRRTVFFRQSESEDSFLQVMSASKSKEKENTNALYTIISTPLKEGEVVNLPQIGVFRPIRQENGKIRVSFTPSSSLRKLLNGEGEPALENKGEALTKEKEKVPLIETVPEKISRVEEKVINSETSAISELTTNVEKEIAKEPSRFAGSGSKRTTLPSASRVACVGDVIVPQDDSIIKSKSKGIPGWVLGLVAAIAVLIVVVITLLSGSNKKTEDEMVLSIPTKSINLPSIAEKHYGNAAFWIYIYEANYDKLSSPVNIPSNVSLLIPDLKNEYNIDVTDSMEIKRANMLSEMLLKKNNSK